MIPLVTVLRNDRRDVELAKAVLETLDVLCVNEPSSANPEKTPSIKQDGSKKAVCLMSYVTVLAGTNT